MSKVELILPNDRWFGGGWEVRPKDKEICVVIDSEYLHVPQIYQYREDRFLCIGDMWVLSEINESVTPIWIGWEEIEWWKPLGLPRDVDERIKAEIEKWLAEDV